MSPPDIEVVDDQHVPRDVDVPLERLRHHLENTWRLPPGLFGWLCSIDHKSIGRRYIVTAFIHLLMAGALAMALRVQLAFPEQQILGPDQYNQFFTMHGTVMMFLFAVPMVEGAMIYLVPLMMGSRIIAFPRLNAFSYYVYLVGGLMVWASFFLNSAPDAGWFSYPPLAGPEYGPGKRSDVFAQMITFTEVAALAVAVEIIVTVLKLRAPGMSLNRMPIFVWSSLVTSFIIVFSMPSVVLGSTFLLLDRLVGTHFYNPAEGGDVLLWQHLFWYFAHPEVYIIFLPSIGLASHVVETFSGRPMFGYPAVVLALISNGLLSFGLWVHHMFATGLPRLGNSFFAASSMTIAIPSGLVLFCWLATIASGRLRFKLPMLWIVSFFILFVMGGLSGVMLASVPLDLQLTDTYVLPSHIHFVLIGGAVAPLVAATFFWFPKMTGRLLHVPLGLVQWTLFTIGGLSAFGSMFLLGLSGMTRRVYSYPHTMQWDTLNLIASVGAWLLGLSFALFTINILWTLSRPARAPENPWQASGLEWSLPSPPPIYNFLFAPFVRSRTPLWDNPGPLPVVGGLRFDRREVLVTTVVEAEPDMRDPVPEPTIWPFITAMVTSVILIASMYAPQPVAWGAIPFAIVMVAWLYPRRMVSPPAASVGPQAHQHEAAPHRRYQSTAELPFRPPLAFVVGDARFHCH
jgi:cytochrome c oxidase subunit I